LCRIVSMRTEDLLIMKFFRTVVIVIAILLFLCEAIGARGSYSTMSAYQRIEDHGVRVSATVVSINMHGKYHMPTCRYIVNGTAYTKLCFLATPNPPIKDVSIGEHVVAYYEAGHPENVAFGDPKWYREIFSHSLHWSIVFSIILLIVIFANFRSLILREKKQRV